MALQIEHIAFDAFSDARLLELAAQDIEVHSIARTSVASLRLAYGIGDDLTLGVKLPYVARRDLREGHADVPPELHVLGDSRGLGDLTALAQWRFLRGEPWQAAALVGVKAPTGKTNRANALGETFDAEHLPGSDSWDGLLGVAASTSAGRLALDANVLLTLAGKGTQDIRLGNRVHCNAALSYRLPEAAHAHTAGASGHSHLAWDLVLELNGEWQNRLEAGGVTRPNSGGSLVYLSPEVRLSAGSWSAFASLGKPVLTRLHGVQHEPDYRVVARMAAGF